MTLKIVKSRIFIPQVVLPELSNQVGDVAKMCSEHGVMPVYSGGDMVGIEETALRSPELLLSALMGFVEVGSFIVAEDMGICTRHVVRSSFVDSYVEGSRDPNLNLIVAITLKYQCVEDAFSILRGWATNQVGARSFGIGPHWVSKTKTFDELAAELGISFRRDVVGNVRIHEIDNSHIFADLLIRLWAPCLLQVGTTRIIAFDKSCNELWLWSVNDLHVTKSTATIRPN